MVQPDQPTQPQVEHWTRDWGGLLRTARQIAGLSLAQLSLTSELSKGYLSKLESSAPGAINPSRSTLAALARALPSFRPLAHTLAPGLGAEQLDYSSAARTVETQYDESPVRPSDGGVPNAGDEACSPESVRFGWRELEVLAALTALERAALPMRITEPMLARAVGRRAEAVRTVLGRLTKQSFIVSTAAEKPGGPHTYRLGPLVSTRVGVTRLGDVLILAASLTSSEVSTNGTGTRQRRIKRAQTKDGHTPVAAVAETPLNVPEHS